jgi:glycosyltransferase involved in cell wall biosynthesis
VRAGAPTAPDARALAVVPVRDEATTIAGVIAGLPEAVGGVPLDVLVIDDGSSDGSGALAHAAGARVVRHDRSRGLGAAVRAGLGIARDEGYAACLYLDGDGEYDPGQAARVLAPVLRGRAEYVVGSRFLGARAGMTWHRGLANRGASALVGTLLGGRVVTDAQSGMRAFGPRALRHAHIAHDYNYAQVLTLALWGHGIEPLEVPIDYRRRGAGASFVRYPEYLRRVAPAVWRQWRHSRATRAATAAATPAMTTTSQAEPVPNSGSAASSGPSGASEPGPTQPAPSMRSSR